MNKIRIFIADDIEMVLNGLLGFITPEPDMEVAGTASDGEELLQLLDKSPGKANFLLVDVNMPKLDGLKAIAKIREKDQNIKIVVMTIFASRDFMVDAMRVGANGFIAKSRGRKEFVETIRRVHGGETIILPDTGDLPLPPPPPPQPINLSPIERRVIALIVSGKKNEEIAKSVKLTVTNVQRIRRNTFSKLGANTTADAVRIAIQHGLTDP
ncbi:MAG: response regulator [Saprospiraceae bacterium]